MEVDTKRVRRAIVEDEYQARLRRVATCPHGHILDRAEATTVPQNGSRLYVRSTDRNGIE